MYESRAMDSYHRSAHPNDPRVKTSSGRRSRSRSPRKSRYSRRSRSKSVDRSYNRSRHDSRSKRHDSRDDRNDRRRGSSPNEHMMADNSYGNYDASVDPNYNNLWPQNPYPQVYPTGYGYAAPPPPPIINNTVNISQPMPPGSTDFTPAAPMWNANDMTMVSGVPPPPTIVLEDEETRKKKEAAIAEEKRNQRLALEKQRDDCKQRAAALSRELEILRNQRKDLTSSSKRSPSPTTMNFIRENDKLQAAIQEKLSTIKNVIEMLTDIIGKDTTKSDEKASEKPKKDSGSSKKDDKKSRKEEKSPVKSREKEKVKEVIKESNGVFNIVHYDPELHWCQLCNVFPKTAKDFLNHLHSNDHQAKQTVEQPWREKLVNDDFPSHPEAPTKRTPIRGLQFFVPATAWFCKLCDFWMGDLHCASVHLKSKKHALEFGKILQKAPNFEIDWATERQRALDKSGGHLQMHENSTGAGNNFLDSIPLQLKTTKPETNNVVHHLMENVLKKIEPPKRKTPEVESKSHASSDKKDKKQKKDDAKDNKKKKRKRKHSSSSSSSDSSSSSSSESSDDSSSSSSSSSDSDEDEDKKKIDPISIVRKLQSEAMAKREKEMSHQGGWTSVPQSAIQAKRLTKPKTPPPPAVERPKINIPGPKIIEFTDKVREKKSEPTSSSTRSHDNDSRGSRNDTTKNKNTSSSSRRPRTPERRDRDRDRTKTTLKIDPSKSSKNAPTPLEKSRDARSRDTSGNKKSESKKESSDDKKKQMLNKKLPFIGRMPVFKKQQAMEKEEQKSKEEAQSCDMDTSNDCDDLMPDPMQYAFLNAPPPPPPPQVYQIQPETVAPQQSYQMSHHSNDDSDEILPPGITQEEHDSIPQTITEAPASCKVPLPKDFQEALNILFDGAKPPSPIPVPEPKEEVEQTYVYDPDAPTILTHEDLSRHSFHEQPNFNDIILPDSLPPPQSKNNQHVNNHHKKKSPSAEEITKAQAMSQQMDALELAMLGIDASDLAAQCMYK